MLSGATPSAAATVGTAVLRIVVSTASMKKATATSHGSSCFAAALATGDGETAAGCSPAATPHALFHEHRRIDGHAWPQHGFGVLAAVDDDLHGHPLHDLDEVPAGIVGRQQ